MIMVCCKSTPEKYKKQQGQALTEVVTVLLLVLIPLFIFSWAFSSYHNTRHEALSAARYAAWERTVWAEKAPSDLPSSTPRVVRTTSDVELDMQDRFFIQPDAPIKTRSGTPTEMKNSNRAGFFRLHNGDSLVELERTSGGAGEGTRPKLELTELGTNTSKSAGVINGITELTSLGHGIDLEDKGLYQSKVSLKLNGIRGVKGFSDLDLTLNETAAVLSNSWSAGGADHEKYRVTPFVPTAALFGEEPAKSIIDTITNIMGFMGLPYDDLELGKIEPDVVPVDRRR